MERNSPLDPLARSVYHALETGLLPSQFQRTRETRVDGKMVTEDVGPPVEHRPGARQVEFIMFSQLWGSTALGFGGIGGAAMTSAYTVVALGPRGDACVYFGGGFAYHVHSVGPAFQLDLAGRQMKPVQAARKAYGATAPKRG